VTLRFVPSDAAACSLLLMKGHAFDFCLQRYPSYLLFTSVETHRLCVHVLFFATSRLRGLI
jgi:hypothetical protein